MGHTNSLQKIATAVKSRKSETIKIGAHKIQLYCGGSAARARFALCWYDGTKRERFESTNPETVVDYAENIIKAAEFGSQAVQGLSVERVQEYLEADTLLDGVNIVELVKHYKEHVKTHTMMSQEIAELYLAAGSDNSSRHKDSVRLHLTKFCKAFKGPISSIKAPALDDYLTKNFKHPKTRLNHRITICSFFSFAERKGYIPVNEAKKTERPKIKVVEPSVVSSQDMTALLENCTSKRVAAFLAVSGFAGCRSSETQRLCWKDIREDGIFLHTHITKTKRRRIAEISANLAAWLKLLRGNPDDFITYPEEEFYTLYEKIRALCKTTGLKRDKNALRHTFASCHLELHRDPPRTSKTAGHSLATLEKDYLKLVPYEEAERWFNIFPTTEKTFDAEVTKPKRRFKRLVAERNAAVNKTNK